MVSQLSGVDYFLNDYKINNSNKQHKSLTSQSMYVGFDLQPNINNLPIIIWIIKPNIQLFGCNPA